MNTPLTIETVSVPRVTATREVEVTVSLDQFEIEAIAEYLRGRGFQVDGTFSRSVIDAMEAQRRKQRRVKHAWEDDDDSDPEYEEGVFILKSELQRIHTLAICGQRDSARDLLVSIVEREGGRRL